jgi:hypothetical protein
VLECERVLKNRSSRRMAPKRGIFSTTQRDPAG